VGPVREERGERVGGLGAGEEVSLVVVASELLEAVELLGLFDAFGDGFEADAVCELHDGVHELDAVALAGEVVDEGLVDLQGVDGQVSQRGE
jgi:hypothetical protein